MSDQVVSPLTRLAGPAAILAGALFTVTQLAVLTLDRNDRVAASMTMTFKISSAGYVTGFFVLMIALFALYQRQAVRAGTFGVVALCVAIAGTMHMAGNQWFDGFVVPWLAEVSPDSLTTAPKTNTIIIAALSSYLLNAIGWVLFGIASFRARVYPRVLCIALIIGGIFGYAAGRAPFGIPLGLAVAALGVWCLTHPEDGQVTTTERATATVHPRQDT